MIQKNSGSPLYLGYDVARDKDAASFYVIGLQNGKKRSVFRLEKRDMSFENQKEVFKRLMSSLPIYRACMDCTGMGSPLCEELKKEFGERLEGVLFTVQTKEMLAMNVKFGLERGDYLLENNRDFHAQIHSIKRTPTVGGNFRYDSERNEKGHSDSFWAWALASNAVIQTNKNINFYSQYANKRSALIVDDTQDKMQQTQHEQISHRGKSLSSVLKNMAKNNV